MATKLWDKGFDTSALVEEYTVGNDQELDLRLARYDVEGSLAHIRMLETIGLLTAEELAVLVEGLEQIAREIEEGKFEIEPTSEDIHSQVELLLTRRLGDVGKKIHSGRSRNDQVLVDLKLFLREELEQLARAVRTLFGTACRRLQRPRMISKTSGFFLWGMIDEPVVSVSGSFTKPKFWLMKRQRSIAMRPTVAATAAMALAAARSLLPRLICAATTL